MNVGGVSMSISQIDTKSKVGVAMLKKNMENNEQVGTAMIKMMDKTLELSANPNVGSNFDVSV